MKRRKARSSEELIIQAVVRSVRDVSADASAQPAEYVLLGVEGEDCMEEMQASEGNPVQEGQAREESPCERSSQDGSARGKSPRKGAPRERAPQARSGEKHASPGAASRESADQAGALPRAMHLAVVVNCSVTMRGLEAALLSALNETLESHKGAPDKDVPAHTALATVIFFGEKAVLVADRVPIASLPAFTHEDMFLHGFGMVLDALREAIMHLERCPRGREEHVKVVMITGSAEPASCNYAYADVVALMEAKRAAGWEFVMLPVG